jgi:hypothetical protein
VGRSRFARGKRQQVAKLRINGWFDGSLHNNLRVHDLRAIADAAFSLMSVPLLLLPLFLFFPLLLDGGGLGGFRTGQLDCSYRNRSARQADTCAKGAGIT